MLAVENSPVEVTFPPALQRAEGLLNHSVHADFASLVAMREQLQPGDRFGYQARLTTDGRLRVVSTTSDGDSGKLDANVSPWKKQSLYFKAGAYLGDNSGSHSEGGRVTFHWLNTAHR